MLRSISRAACAPWAGLILLAFTPFAATSAAAASSVNQSFFGVAIEGIDPVGYFEESRPVKGSSDFEHEWMGATWRFASAANRDAFAADPGRYAPQYGGYCAYAVSQGAKAGIDPEAWKILDGKLYLNLNKTIQARWEKDRERYITQADSNWPTLAAQ